MSETTERVALSWSGGKDSCLALYELSRDERFTVEILLSTVTADYDRVSMHGVRWSLLQSQAESLGLPLRRVEIPAGASNEVYESRMGEALIELRTQEIETAAFGDLFLEDIRQYRERQIEHCGMSALFPVWMRDTRAFAEEFIDLGFRAVVVCLDPKKLDPSFGGRDFDRSFLEDLPPEVDPCGENGEFHTFVYDGPSFARKLDFEVGETVERDGFIFTDLVPNLRYSSDRS